MAEHYRNHYLKTNRANNFPFEQLQQCLRIVADGDLISKSERDFLVDLGLIARAEGFNIITQNGIKLLNLMGYLSH